MFRALVALVLLAAPLSGCFGDGEPAATVDPADDGDAGGASAPASPSGQPAPASPSSPAATSPSQTAEGDAPPAAEAPTAEPVQRTTPFAWDGTFAYGACVPMGPNACMSHRLAERKTLFEIPVAGAPLALDAKATWEAATPASAEIGLVLLAVKSCGERCWEGRALGEPAIGPSPLSLAVPGISLDEGEVLHLYAYRDNPLAHPGGAPVYWYVETEQAFHVEGALVEMVVPTA